MIKDKALQLTPVLTSSNVADSLRKYNIPLSLLKRRAEQYARKGERKEVHVWLPTWLTLKTLILPNSVSETLSTAREYRSEAN
jgi:hypothetical protein